MPRRLILLVLALLGVCAGGYLLGQVR